MNEGWKTLYDAALAVAVPHTLSDSMEAATVGAAVESESGKIYTGVCIDATSGLGFCAERNALAAMMTHGEYRAIRVCSVYYKGNLMPPCGACRAFMLQMGDGAGDIEVLLDQSGRTARLRDLMPEWC